MDDHRNRRVGSGPQRSARDRRPDVGSEPRPIADTECDRGTGRRRRNPDAGCDDDTPNEEREIRAAGCGGKLAIKDAAAEVLGSEPRKS